MYGSDLHAELTRQNKKKNQTTVGRPSQVTSGDHQGVGPEGTSQVTTPLHQAHQPDPNTPAIPMETSSPLIKANPSPHGTPLHTTFAGTQRFTPSTRISALNMVGDLLRKVGVRNTSSHKMPHIMYNHQCRHWSQGWHPVEHTFQLKIPVILVLLALLMLQGNCLCTVIIV